MVFQPFTIAEKRPIRPGMTISRPLHLGQSIGAAWSSLGAGTSISPERYDRPALYVGAAGEGALLLGEEHRRVPLSPDVLMAFDAGTGLTPHRAPGNAILTALDGKATIGYEGHDYELTAGQSFRFEKNGLHSVTANAKFKMSLLLVLE